MVAPSSREKFFAYMMKIVVVLLNEMDKSAIVSWARLTKMTMDDIPFPFFFIFFFNYMYDINVTLNGRMVET